MYKGLAWGVQVGLIVGLILGTAGVGAFVGVQIAQEGRTAVRAVTEALPAWSADAPDGDETALMKQVPCSCCSDFESHLPPPASTCQLLVTCISSRRHMLGRRNLRAPLWCKRVPTAGNYRLR